MFHPTTFIVLSNQGRFFFFKQGSIIEFLIKNINIDLRAKAFRDISLLDKLISKFYG